MTLRYHPPMRAILPFVLMLLPLATPQTKDDPCLLSEAQVKAITGISVVGKELRPWTFGVTQCVYKMERGTVQFQRVVPEAKNVKTEAELAAKFATDDARRRLKDFSVPAYSFSGGVNVVLPDGVWQVLTIQGPGGGLDSMKLAQAIVTAKSKK